MTASGVDPFDLPDWLGGGEVVWTAAGGVHQGHRIAGELAGSGERLACDLLAVDQAYPAPVCDDPTRRLAHRAWSNDQVLIVTEAGRLTLAVPGSGFTADRVIEAIGRLAKAVGVRPGEFVVTLRL